MIFIYTCMVIAFCLNSGNSLENTKNRFPSEERFNFFDAELLQVFNQRQNSNVLISPISIKLVLGMLAEGAEDQTAAEIRAALRLPDDEEARRKEFNTWLSVLQTKAPPNVLKVANRMFLSNRYTVDPLYGKTLSKYYSGGVTSVKFQDAREASQVINTWVGNQTSQLIPSLVEEGQISSDNKLMLASAVYFKGLWSVPFASERTSVRCFYRSKGDSCNESLMMMETGYFDYGYVSRLDAKAIVLPYKGGQFSMLLLLPSKRDGIRLLTRDLLHVSLSSILSELKEEEVFVQIPQFEITSNDDLVESLKTVQISEVFTSRANLSKMFTTGLESTPVSHVYHSAKIVVNEEGSEAAAATGAMFVPLMGGTTTSFAANHPFLFFVMDSIKNSVLFAGKVVNPQTNDPKKRIFSANTQQPKKTHNRLPGNSLTPLKNTTTAAPSQDTKHGQRGQQPGPKFRSIKPAFSPLGLPSNRALPSHTGVFYEKEPQTYKKRGKTIQDSSRNRKRQDSHSDDWRHHVLFFS